MWRKSRSLDKLKETDEAVLRARCSIENKFEKLCGFRSNDLSSFQKFVTLLYRPADPSSLGVIRALFGLCMVVDVVEERGLSDVDLKWGDPMECHFPLVHGMKPPPLPWMILVYTVMWLGAFGIMLGLRFKIACACFAIPYWYIFLLDKSYWNNHTYLYGLVATLLWGTEANKYFALDALNARKNHETETVPLWNYFILRFQFFALYFLAGLKKSSAEWLSGYAMTNLSRHWVFSPFKLFLTTEQTDFFVVHWFAFIFDLTVGFWMLFDKTRAPAMIFCTAFHLMNSRLFSIGMFPYVCLATMPLFCSTDWPRRLGSFLKRGCAPSLLAQKHKATRYDESSTSQIEDFPDKPPISQVPVENSHKAVANKRKSSCDKLLHETKDKSSIDDKHRRKCGTSVENTKEINDKCTKPTKRQKFVASVLLFHVFLQFFLPYSHFITKGYNNWVPGMYGYSWDMMVHVWDTVLVVIKVHDNVNNQDRYLDPKAWVQTDRWEKHGDMARQYAFCIRDNLIQQESQILENHRERERRTKWTPLSSNLSIYIDVWCSLNGRFQQRMFDPNVDLLTVDWHPFKPITYLMPLLSQYNSYRYKLEEIQQHVYTWSNETDVLFVADFPGMHLDNFISKNFTNVTLTVLEGEVTYSDEKQGEAVVVSKGSSIPIVTDQFHKIKTISAYPACYMYTYTNRSKQRSELDRSAKVEEQRDSISIATEIGYKIDAWSRSLRHIANALFYLIYNVPMVRRVQINT